MSKVKLHKTFNMPFRVNPNLETLKYYFKRDLFKARPSKFNRYLVEPSETPYEFKFETIEDKAVKRQLKTKGILSYLYFEDDKIIIDEVSPKKRLGQLFDDETKFRSNSMGKSLTSYILGHAICEGYIDSVDSTINDWNLVKDTLYENHKLIDLLNMTSGDQKYAYDSHTLKGQEWNTQPHENSDLDDNNIQKTMIIWFKNKKPSSERFYNYNVLNSQLIFNYILFKTGDDDFQKLLDGVFREKARIKDIVHFYKLDGSSKTGNAHSMFYATRYDYLRIAKAIMDDYQNDACLGKYLKEIYDRRIPKNINHYGSRAEPHYNRTKSYGGQFHLDYPRLEGKVVFGMGGFGGKAILIDVEDSRIVVVNSIHYNHDQFKYDHHKLLINPIKNGKKSFK
jgi:CubicO group peptidase (beta-lactamase class C family)